MNRSPKRAAGFVPALTGVREASKEALAEKVLEALHEMAEQGTTTVEAKSGYGLTRESELKSLEAIRAGCHAVAGNGGCDPSGGPRGPKRVSRTLTSICGDRL